MAVHLRDRDEDWRSIAEQTTNEMDPAKLLILVEKLCCALDNKLGKKYRTEPTSRGNEPGSVLGHPSQPAATRRMACGE
jgi:hypothetical protein